jgi:hypothetical protein
MSHHFESLLTYVVATPDATVKDLQEKLDESDRERWSLKEKELEAVERLAFTMGRRRTITQYN